MSGVSKGGVFRLERRGGHSWRVSSRVGTVRGKGKKMAEKRKEMSNAEIRRLARRGGVRRIGKEIYDETRFVLREFLKNTIRDAVIYTDHGKRKTVTVMDVVFALKRQGRPLYGFDPK